MKNFAPAGKVYQAGTYSGNPISVTASLATLKILRDRRTTFYDEMEQKCEAIVNSLKKLMNDFDLSLQLNHIASMFQVFFTEVFDYKSAKTADITKFMKYQSELLEKGVFIPPSQFETCFISDTHSNEDIEKTVEAMKESLSFAAKS